MFGKRSTDRLSVHVKGRRYFKRNFCGLLKLREMISSFILKTYLFITKEQFKY